MWKSSGEFGFVGVAIDGWIYSRDPCDVGFETYAIAFGILRGNFFRYRTFGVRGFGVGGCCGSSRGDAVIGVHRCIVISPQARVNVMDVQLLSKGGF
jgi:hypothetical protein